MSIYRFSYSLVLILILQQIDTSICKTDTDLLLQFKKSLGNTTALSSWDPLVPPCNKDDENWAGVLCEVGIIWGLKLENMGLNGQIDLDLLSEMKSLRAISLMNNNFEGPLPDIQKLGSLKTIYLSNNKFSGDIPPMAFEGMKSIKKIHLANNEFSGSIPESLSTLPKLIELMLENNQFEGEILEFKQNFVMVNFSNNQLEGPIPASLNKFKESSFSGNKDLCGTPLKACDVDDTSIEPIVPASPEPSSTFSTPKLSLATIVVVVTASTIAITSLIAVVFILRKPRKTEENQDYRHQLQSDQTPTNESQNVANSSNLEKMERGFSPDRSSGPNNTNKKTDQGVKLTFLQENRQRFDMSDLLKASAEILGSGVFGSSYKAALSIGAVVVVKRYREMNNVSKEEFHEHMRRLGQLNHPNLLPLVAFFYRKEEKLLIADHVNNVSLAVHLHGNKSSGQPSLDWPTRLKIVKGVSKGLLYLYNSLQSLITPHGHLKSSNVLLTANLEPLLTDYALLPVVNLEHAQEQMIAYKSPEFKQNRRITKKTDIWSLGILILEILSAKFPSNFLQQGQGGGGGSDADDLATWANSMLNEGCCSEIFDKEMPGTKNSDGEMMKLLKIALSCCQDEIDKRLDIREAVEKIEQVKEKDTNNNNNNNNVDDEFFSTRGSEADIHSSRGLSNDFDHINI